MPRRIQDGEIHKDTERGAKSIALWFGAILLVGVIAFLLVRSMIRLQSKVGSLRDRFWPTIWVIFLIIIGLFALLLLFTLVVNLLSRKKSHGVQDLEEK